MLAVSKASSRLPSRRKAGVFLSRQLSTRPLPVTPMPIGYCGRNHRFIYGTHNKPSLALFHVAPLALAQRAFAAAEILALPAALIVRFLAGAFGAGFAPLIFAHRAFCAAATAARPAALIPRFLGAFAGIEAGAPRIEASSLFNASISSLRSAARRSCSDDNDDNVIDRKSTRLNSSHL